MPATASAARLEPSTLDANALWRVLWRQSWLLRVLSALWSQVGATRTSPAIGGRAANAH